MDTALEPRDIDWHEKGVLSILWSDGHRGIYPVRHLRQNCPCAGCVDEWTGERRIKPDSIPLLVLLQDIQPVGRYAFRFQWSDGHDTGIYSFTSLRKMCQCDICVPNKPKKKALL